MKKIDITTIALIFMTLICLSALACSKQTAPLFTAPLCDCNCHSKESSCHPWEVCDAGAACITANANTDKCVPTDREDK